MTKEEFLSAEDILRKMKSTLPLYKFHRILTIDPMPEENNNIRIGNIEFRENRTDRRYGEIVCNYPNPCYGRESEYHWTEDGEFAYQEDYHCRTHKSCFKSKESCYTVAFVLRCGDEEPNIESVGSRFLHLSSENFRDYHAVLRAVFATDWSED